MRVCGASWPAPWAASAKEGGRARVVGATGSLDELAHRVPVAGQHGCSREGQRELGVLSAGRLVEHRARDVDCLPWPALQAEQPDALRGRGGPVASLDSSAGQLVEEPPGRTEGSVCQVAPYQSEQQVGGGVVDTRPQQELGCRRVVVRTAAGEEDLGRSPGQHRSFRWQHEAEHRLVGERVAPAQGARVDRQQPGLLRGAQGREYVGLRDARDPVEQRPVRGEPEHRGTGEHPAMLGGQQGEPVGHQRSQRRGYGAGPAQCHQLLDKERQPVGAVVEHRPRCGVGRSAEGYG